MALKLLGAAAGGLLWTCISAHAVDLGPRPAFLVDLLPEGALKTKLEACIGQQMTPRLFSIAHRGAPLQFPEHTLEGYLAAHRMGAGIQECDVTFTKDKALVCRHSQNDLATTTNILTTPLVDTCIQPFTAASGDTKASAECRTSELSLAEFKSLRGKMDGANPAATTAEAYVKGTADWRTTIYASNRGTVLSHKEFLAHFKNKGVKFTPELKAPAVEMPFDGFTQEDYAQQLINEYKAAGIAPENVFPQSFNLADVLYWIKAEPEFGKQAVYLEGRYGRDNLDPMKPETFKPTMAELKGMGVNYLAPPLWVLVTLQDGEIVPSAYAMEAKKAGLKLIAWSLERSGPLNNGGGWYYQSIRDAVTSDAAIYQVLDVLAQDVGVEGVFSDWPATTTFYANCMDLP